MHASASSDETLLNGAGAAAILAAGIGSFTLGLLTVLADKIPSFKAAMIIWKPTGPLSGVTTFAIVVWFAAWALLDARWKRREVGLRRINVIALVLVALSMLLMFPPFIDLL